MIKIDWALRVVVEVWRLRAVGGRRVHSGHMCWPSQKEGDVFGMSEHGGQWATQSAVCNG